MPLRRHLLLLVFSILIPAVAACGIAVLFAYSDERQRSEENLVRTTQALAESLDQKIDMIVRLLETLATSPSLPQGNLQAFLQQAHQAVKEESMWIVLLTRDGQQVVNTLLTYGEPLPIHAPDHPFTDVLKRSFETRVPIVSDIFVGPVTKKPTLAVTVPVFDSTGKVIYCLGMGMLPSALKNTVSSASLPKQWLAAAFDAKMTVIARSLDPEISIGMQPVPALAAAMQSSDAGIIDATSQEGIATRVAFSRSPKYGWHFAVGVPMSELAASVYRTVLLFLAIALAMLAAGAVFALKISRGISSAITSLGPAAYALRRGGRLVHRETGVLEVDEVSSALEETSGVLLASITERERAEEALRTAKERAEDVLSSITDGFYALDKDWQFTYVNLRAQQILGVTASQMQGQNFFDIFPQVRGTVVHETYMRVMAARHPEQFDSISPILKRWTAFSVYPAGDGGIAVYFRDISRQKAVEAELMAAKEEAERANLAKSQFLASASHDLRQPVQSLFFFHEVLANKLKDHPCNRVVANMQSGLDALKSLLDGLLDISRLHAGAVEVQTVIFPVATLLDRLEAENAARAEAQGIALRVVGSTAWVRSDMAQLERILRNLIDNALKYTHRGGTVLVGCRRSGGNLRIQVADTGPGIPQNKQDAIFEEFVQLGNPERDRAKGLGLGLAIVRHLGRLLGHEITVRSRLGHGTTFSVVTPIAHARKELHAPAARVQLPHAGGLALIVDDEALVLDGLRSMLESWGWDALAAESGETAVKLAAGSSQAPDVIIADYRLRGGETGIQAVRDINKACASPIPAVILTGDTSPERIAECTSSGFRLLHKPIDAPTLGTILNEIKTPLERFQA